MSAATPRAVKVLGLMLTGLGIVASILLFVLPTPASSLGGWVVGSTVGRPTTVELPYLCRSYGRAEPSRKLTCPGATWQDGDQKVTGTLYGRRQDLTTGDELGDHVDARVFGSTAYARPPASNYGVVIAALALVVVGLASTAFGTLATALGGPGEASVSGDAGPNPSPLRPLAERHGLGQVISAYRTSEFSMAELILVIAAQLALAVMAGVVATLVTAEDHVDVIIAAGIGVAAVGAVGFRLRKRHHWRRRHRGALAGVCEHGVLVSSAEHTFACRWSEAEFIGTPVALSALAATAPFSIRAPGGRTFTFDGDSWDEIRLLRGSVYENVYRVAAERLHADFHAGRDVTFGDVTVNRAGVTRGGTSLPYEEIRGLVRDNDNLTILPRRASLPTVRLPVAATPNVEILMQLLGRGKEHANARH